MVLAYIERAVERFRGSRSQSREARSRGNALVARLAEVAAEQMETVVPVVPHEIVDSLTKLLSQTNLDWAALEKDRDSFFANLQSQNQELATLLEQIANLQEYGDTDNNIMRNYTYAFLAALCLEKSDAENLTLDTLHAKALANASRIPIVTKRGREAVINGIFHADSKQFDCDRTAYDNAYAALETRLLAKNPSVMTLNDNLYAIMEGDTTRHFDFNDEISAMTFSVLSAMCWQEQ